MPNSGLENYHLPTRELPHNDSKRSTPSLDSASTGSAPLCLLTSGTFQLCKASSSEIGEWAPTVRGKKKKIIKDQKYPHKSQCALQHMYLPDSNELWEGFTLNAIHRSVNCNSRMYSVFALKKEMPPDSCFSHEDVFLHLQATVQNFRSDLPFLYTQNI